jgi:plasmid maintenance system antidote protein VapI
MQATIVAKTKIIQKKYITERTTNRMTSNFGFSPSFWQQVPKTKRERQGYMNQYPPGGG